MKILVIELPGAHPDILFRNEQLVNVRRLMELGCYGKLNNVVPVSPLLSNLCMVFSQDPGTLGVYGLFGRVDYSYKKVKIDPITLEGTNLRSLISDNGGQSFLINQEAAWMKEVKSSITQANQVNYPELDQAVVDYSQDGFDRVKQILLGKKWDCLHFIENGLGEIQKIFWHFYDPNHPLYQKDSSYQAIIPAYYEFLDRQIGELLELIDDETAVMLVSGFGYHPIKGVFNLNDWLIREGWLVLNQKPRSVTPMSGLDINWDTTKAWAVGGDYAQIFLNIRGREQKGSISKDVVLELRKELKHELESIPDAQGNCLENQVFRPEEIYKNIHNISPDLIIYLGGKSWQCNDDVGHTRLYHPQPMTLLKTALPNTTGAFILASVNNPLSGEIHNAHVLDIVPTLLDVAGYDIPASMQGRSLVSGFAALRSREPLSQKEHDLLRERLSGLGYIS
jgi:predicted AlkP superfamily phosphohydrolase/phosphomutase